MKFLISRIGFQFNWGEFATLWLKALSSLIRLEWLTKISSPRLSKNQKMAIFMVGQWENCRKVWAYNSKALRAWGARGQQGNLVPVRQELVLRNSQGTPITQRNFQKTAKNRPSPKSKMAGFFHFFSDSFVAPAGCHPWFAWVDLQSCPLDTRT